MKARPGDRIILAAATVDGAVRDGEVLETRGDDGAPPYLVRWSDGHETLVTALLTDEESTLLRYQYGEDESFDYAAGWLYNGMAAAAEWMSAASFISMAGGLYLRGFGGNEAHAGGLAYVLGTHWLMTRTTG